MKKLNLLFTFLIVTVCTFADNNFKEDFESGLPTSASSSETSVTLSSGTWRIKSVSGKKDNNSMRALFTTNGAYLITPALNQPGRVTFNHRSGGAGKKITVEKSADGGQTWEELGVATTSSASAYGSSSFKCTSTEEDAEVLIRFTSNSSSTYIDNVDITLNAASGPIINPDIPDDPTYITEGVWVPTKPFPTALNEIYVAPNANANLADGTIDPTLTSRQPSTAQRPARISSAVAAPTPKGCRATASLPSASRTAERPTSPLSYVATTAKDQSSTSRTA